MNGTELKTLRQSLFLSQAECARLHGVKDRVYRYWEGGDWVVPDDVAARMLALDALASRMAAEGVVDWERLCAAHGKPEFITLLRYACDEDWWRGLGTGIRARTAAGMPANAHAAAIDRFRQALEAAGQRVRVVTMDWQDYEDWLGENGYTDDSAMRAAWAATVTDPPPRAKKTGQASGE